MRGTLSLVVAPDADLPTGGVCEVPSTGTVLRYMDPESICPGLLGLDYIGEADSPRGRVVRGFFWLMRRWPKPSRR